MHGNLNHNLPDDPVKTDFPEEILEQIAGIFEGDSPRKCFVSCSLQIPPIDPLSLIEQRIEDSYLYYWERPNRDFSLAAGGMVTSLKATGSDRFKEIGTQSRQLKKQVVSIGCLNHSLAEPLLVGGYSFADHNISTTWKKFGAAHFILPEWTLIKSGKLNLLTLTVPIKDRDQSEVIQQLKELLTTHDRISSDIRSYFKPGTSDDYSAQTVKLKDSSKKNWEKQVQKSKELIRRGRFEKVVIARQVELTSNHPIQVPLAMYHLRKLYPECYNFISRMDGGAYFMGATPERLISLRKDLMKTEGLAGSISRGRSATEDVSLGHTLMESDKERSEHDFVVRDIRNTLKKHSHRIEHPSQPSLKKLSNVQHLYTPISAKIHDSTTIHELAGVLHPTPAVGGFPKTNAVPFINQIEDVDRGWYAGPTGWFNLKGFGELAVAIRSAWVENNRAQLYAGCGIVEDSDPLTEWEETRMKFRPLLDALTKATVKKNDEPTN